MKKEEIALSREDFLCFREDSMRLGRYLDNTGFKHYTPHTHHGCTYTHTQIITAYLHNTVELTSFSKRVLS